MKRSQVNILRWSSLRWKNILRWSTLRWKSQVNILRWSRKSGETLREEMKQCVFAPFSFSSCRIGSALLPAKCKAILKCLILVSTSIPLSLRTKFWVNLWTLTVWHLGLESSSKHGRHQLWSPSLMLSLSIKAIFLCVSSFGLNNLAHAFASARTKFLASAAFALSLWSPFRVTGFSSQIGDSQIGTVFLKQIPWKNY